jgi:hypothetical protein
MSAPTGRKARVTVMVRARSGILLPKSLATLGSTKTRMKKSKASSVQPRKLATSALT